VLIVAICGTFLITLFGTPGYDSVERAGVNVNRGYLDQAWSITRFSRTVSTTASENCSMTVDREHPVHMREQAGEQTEVFPGQSHAGRDDLKRWRGTGRDTPAGAPAA
jgi:hypothetical protein